MNSNFSTSISSSRSCQSANECFTDVLQIMTENMIFVFKSLSNNLMITCAYTRVLLWFLSRVFFFFFYQQGILKSDSKYAWQPFTLKTSEMICGTLTLSENFQNTEEKPGRAFLRLTKASLSPRCTLTIGSRPRPITGTRDLLIPLCEKGKSVLSLLVFVNQPAKSRLICGGENVLRE